MRVRFASDQEDGLPDAVEQALSHTVQLLGIPSPSGMTDRAMEYCYHTIAPLGFPLRRTHRGGLIVRGPGIDCSHAQERTHRDAIASTMRLLALYVQSE